MMSAKGFACFYARIIFYAMSFEVKKMNLLADKRNICAYLFHKSNTILKICRHRDKLQLNFVN